MSDNVSRETFFKKTNDIIDIHDPIAAGEPVLPAGVKLIKTPEGICSMVGSFRKEIEPLLQKKE